jgi:hypothetical protein
MVVLQILDAHWRAPRRLDHPRQASTSRLREKNPKRVQARGIELFGHDRGGKAEVKDSSPRQIRTQEDIKPDVEFRTENVRQYRARWRRKRTGLRREWRRRDRRGGEEGRSCARQKVGRNDPYPAARQEIKHCHGKLS